MFSCKNNCTLHALLLKADQANAKYLSQAIREIEVLKAIRHEASSAILVYASDRAMLVEEGDLPAQLKVSG